MRYTHSRWLLIPALFLLLAADKTQTDADAAKLQGGWTVELMERAGERIKENKLQKMRVVFEGDTFQLFSGKTNPPESATFNLDPSQNPKSIDLHPPSPRDRKPPAHGIYQLDGDTLKLCWQKEGGRRPTKFATQPQDRASVLIILKREKK